MTSFKNFFLFVATMAIVTAVTTHTYKSIPQFHNDNWIIDPDNYLTLVQQRTINSYLNQQSRLKKYHFELNHNYKYYPYQVGVVVVDSVNGKPSQISEKYFNRVGLGFKDVNNGVLLFISVKEREIIITPGRGISNKIISQNDRKSIMQKMIPSFRNKHYYNGIVDGVEHLVQLLVDKSKENYNYREIEYHSNLLLFLLTGFRLVFFTGFGLIFFFLFNLYKKYNKVKHTPNIINKKNSSNDSDLYSLTRHSNDKSSVRSRRTNVNLELPVIQRVKRETESTSVAFAHLKSDKFPKSNNIFTAKQDESQEVFHNLRHEKIKEESKEKIKEEIKVSTNPQGGEAEHQTSITNRWEDNENMIEEPNKLVENDTLSEITNTDTSDTDTNSDDEEIHNSKKPEKGSAEEQTSTTYRW